jgi:hypothetical protein
MIHCIHTGHTPATLAARSVWPAGGRARRSRNQLNLDDKSAGFAVFLPEFDR